MHILPVLYLFIFCFTNLFSMEDCSRDDLIQSSNLELLNLSDGEVKMYISPDAIVATGQGLFVKTENGNDIPIPFLVSSDRGCYTVLRQNDSTVYPVIRCSNCHLPFSPTFFNKGKCPHCGAQN